MPKDKSGKFHNSTQRAMRADKFAGPKPPPSQPPPAFGGPPPMPGAAPPPVPGMEEPPSPVHEHLGAMNSEMGGRHMLVHHDGMNITSHQVGEDGAVQGPHDHSTIEDLDSAMHRFLMQEEQEQPAEQEMEPGETNELY